MKMESWMAEACFPHQVKGFGLGVMNARAAYYAKKGIPVLRSSSRTAAASAPHGEDLVIANSISHYDDAPLPGTDGSGRPC